jgi:UPF0716 protein FxsA
VVLLVLIFLVVPIVELYVIIQVGQEIGALYTIALLVVISITGAWLAKREGMGVWRRLNQQVSAGRVPAAELLDAFLILLAAALLITPGFITDVLAIVLLIPPTRAFVRRVVRRRFLSKVEIYRGAATPSRPPDLDV